MIIDGEIYPLHLAVSRHWKVHYFTADLLTPLLAAIHFRDAGIAAAVFERRVRGWKPRTKE
jgi:hypothetical protein